MPNPAFIVRPSALATQLSALTGRPAINKSTPAMASNGRPIDPAASAQRSLKAAIARFNNAE